MTKVTVYRIRTYDFATDDYRTSRRWATREGAETMRGEIIPDGAIQIDESDLEPGEQWTRTGYAPSQSGGFQKQVSGTPRPY